MNINSHKALHLSILLHVIPILLTVFLINFDVEEAKKERKMCHINLSMVQHCEIKSPQKCEDVEEKKVLKDTIKKDIVEKGKSIKKSVIEKKVKKREITKKKLKKIVTKKEKVVPITKEKEELKDVKEPLHVEPIKSSVEALHVEDYKVSYLQENIRRIEQLIKEHLIYPRKARVRNISGIVHLKFTITTDSKVTNLRVLEQDYEILGRSAVKTIESIGTKFPSPKENLTISVPIKFMLK